METLRKEPYEAPEMQIEYMDPEGVICSSSGDRDGYGDPYEIP